MSGTLRCIMTIGPMLLVMLLSCPSAADNTTGQLQKDKEKNTSLRTGLPEGPLTIEKALEIAFANNPDVIAGDWDIRAAQARTEQATSRHLPTVELTAAYRHHWHEERLVPARGQSTNASFSNDIFSGDVVLSIPLFEGGRAVSSVNASRFLKKAAERGLEQTREELVFNIKSTFYTILGQDRLVDAVEYSIQALEEHLRKTEELLSVQKAARVDVLNIEVRLADLMHQLVRQRGISDMYRRLLVNLMGIEKMPRGGFDISGDLSAYDVSTNSEKLIIKAVSARPDMARLDAEIEAQKERIDIAWAGWWPVVSAKGTYGARASAQGDYDDLGFAGIELSFPFFTGLETAARVDEEEARLRILEEKKRKLGLDIRGEIDSAVIRTKTALARIEATSKAIAMARESLDIARKKAAVGHGTTMDVLDAQAALLKAETMRFTALTDLHTACALLDLASGGAS